jgi:hypothetical protein
MRYFSDMKKTFAWLLALAALPVLADQVEMQNGDRYTGRVLSLSADSVVLQNDILGKLTLPRSKVTLLSVGSAAPTGATAGALVASSAATLTTNRAPASPKSIVLTNGNPDLAGALKSLGANTNFIEQIKGQFLADAGPEANQQFSDMLGGLLSGKIDMAALRAQAKSASDQLRAYQKELGPEASDTYNTYLAILDHFLQETK